MLTIIAEINGASDLVVHTRMHLSGKLDLSGLKRYPAT